MSAVLSLITGKVVRGQEGSVGAPVLSLAGAIQIALDNNRPVIIAKLDIAKAQWELAQTKTKRFPAITTYLFASGDITQPQFTFPAGIFNTDKPTNVNYANGITGYASVQAAQPLSQLYQIHLAIRLNETLARLHGRAVQG